METTICKAIDELLPAVKTLSDNIDEILDLYVTLANNGDEDKLPSSVWETLSKLEDIRKIADSIDR